MSYTRIAPRIYKDSRTGNFYERPTVNGKKTWRKLRVRTLMQAKELLAAKRSDQTRAAYGLAKDPYAEKPYTIASVCADYLSAGCPNRRREIKTGKSLLWTERRINSLLPFWAHRFPSSIKEKDCTEYYAQRKAQIERGDGGRLVDVELGILSDVIRWAISVGKADSNPLATGRPRFKNTKTVKHCRDYSPISGDELHALAAHLFENPRSESLGWQLLLEAMTGCRTSEVLRFRWDAKHMTEPGFIDGNTVWLARAKGGVKPFVEVHPTLARCLSALKQWHLWRFPKSKWWFPSARRGKDLPVTPTSLTRALGRASKLHRTSHGLRAYYVTVRRSEGISDAQIADEIGDKSGAAIIVSTYGSVPPNWRGSESLSWLPTKGKPAWEMLKMPENIIALQSSDGSKFQTGPKPVRLSR